MAEEARSRLAFENVHIQAQGVAKIHALIKDKLHTAGKILDEKSQHEFNEVHILWEHCTSPSTTISTGCCQCLVQLAQEGHIHFHYVLTGLLNCLPAAKSPTAPIQAITELLLFQINHIKDQGQTYTCPYTLRSPSPHPFISVLTSRPDVTHVLLDQVNSILLTQHPSNEVASVFTMLVPFIKFVLVDPRSSADQTFRLQLLTVLLDAASSNILAISDKDEHEEILSHEIIDLLVLLLSYYQLDTRSIGQTTFLAHVLSKWMVENFDWIKASEKHDQLKNVVLYLLSLCHERLRLGLDIKSTLQVLNAIQETCTKTMEDADVLWCLAVLLMDSSSLYAEQILKLWSRSVGEYPLSQLLPELRVPSTGIILPLLHILSSQYHIQSYSSRHKGHLTRIASQALQRAENIVSLQEEHTADGIKKHESNQKLHSPSPWMRQMVIISKNAAILLGDEEACVKWLQGLRSSIPSCKACPNQITLLLSTLLLASSNRVISEVLDVLVAVAAAVPTQSPNFLPLLLYKLGKVTSADLKLKFLYTIPELATHKLCVGPVLRTIQSLALSPSLRPVALRLMCKLWQKQSRVFPHLQRALINAEDGVKGELLVELQIAKAATIRDVCLHRASQHGGDLLGMLSNLINENACSTSESTVAIVALALQGIKALCQAEVVDLCTAWRVLAPKLNNDKRPSVMKSLCELFALVPVLVTDTEAYQSFKSEVLSYLWSTTQHQLAWVASSAFAALSNFHLEEFKIMHLPEEVSDYSSL